MATVGLAACLLGFFAPSVESLEVRPPEARLVGSDNGLQIVALGLSRGAAEFLDLTHDPELRYRSTDPRVATVGTGGSVRPAGDGIARIEVRWQGFRAEVRVMVSDFANTLPVDFDREVVPIFTKAGCNKGACHGKSGGQNGFQLSLWGFDPASDYERIVVESRGRRLFPAAPAASLILRKPTAQLPHRGGHRLDVGSPEYRTISRWIAQGMPRSSTRGAVVTGLRVEPQRRRMRNGEAQQLRVSARYQDGRLVDVTRLSHFESNGDDVAEVNSRGLVRARDGVGDSAVTARFGGHVGIARVTVPRGSLAEEWEPPGSANPIDRPFFAKLRELGLSPSAPCTASEFARRSSLDLCGVLPAPEDVVALERDQAPEARDRWVERLLARPEYADLFAMKWSALLKNRRTLGLPSRAGSFAFHAWIRQALAANLPYDQFVSRILTARGDSRVRPEVVWYRQVATLEERTDDSAQLFLGQRLQCARCHQHPYDRWGPADYYGFASLFSRVGGKPGRDPLAPQLFVLPSGLARDPTTGTEFPPRLLGGPGLGENDPHRDPRQALAEWLTSPGNSFFAKAVVNRYWKHFFGRGLVEPEDDLRASNPPSNPELLDALAADFIAHGFDLRRLVRTIATSRAYGLSSVPEEGNRGDRRNFARFYPRRLPAEVLLDAIATVTGTAHDFEGLPRSFRAVQLPDEATEAPDGFLQSFGRPKRESVCECERSASPSLSQGLLLLNSAELQARIRDPGGRAARWARDPRPDGQKVEELYRLALSRPPGPEERKACLDHLAGARAVGRISEGYEDLVWAILNTKEFLFNR